MHAWGPASLTRNVLCRIAWHCILCVLPCYEVVYADRGQITCAHRLIAQEIGGALSKLVEHKAGPGIVQEVQVVKPADPFWQILCARQFQLFLTRSDMPE